MADENIDIKIVADAKQAVQEINNFAKEAKAGLNGVESGAKSSMAGLKDGLSGAVSGFGGLATAIGGVVAAVGLFKLGGMAVDVIKESVASAQEAQKAYEGLQTSLKMNGNYSEEASKKLEAFGAAMQATTVYSDDAINANLAVLESMTALSADGLIVAQKAAMDLASSFNIDLETATRMIGKAANGETAAFGKLGIKIDEGATKSDTFANTLKALGNQMGRSERDADTYAGSIAQLSNAYGDIYENIGNVIINNEAVKESIQTLKNVFIALADQVNANSESIGSFVSGALNGLLKAIPMVITSISTMVSWVTKAYAGIELLEGMIVLLAGSITRYALKAFEMIGDTIGQVSRLILNLADGFMTLMQAMASALGDDAQAKQFEKWGNSISSIDDELKKIIDNDYVGDMVNDIDAFGKHMLDASVDTVNGGNKISSAFDKTATAIVKLEPAANKAEKAFGNVVTGAKKGADETQKWTVQTDKLAESIKKTAEESAKKLVDENVKAIDDIKKRYENFGLSRVDIEQKSLSDIQKNLDIALNANRISLDEHHKLIELASKSSQQEITKIQKEEMDKQVAEAKKKADEQKAVVEGYASFATTWVDSGLQGVASKAIGMFADTILPGIGGAVSAVFDMLSQNADDFKAQLNSMFDASFVENIVNNVFVLLEELPSLVENLISGLIMAIPQFVKSLLKFVADPKNWFSLGIAVIEGVLKGLVGLGKMVLDEIKYALRNPISFKGTNLTKKFRESFDKMLNWFGEFGDKIKQAFGDAIDYIKKPIEDLFKTITTFFSNLWKGFSDAAKKAWEAIKSILTPIFTAISAIVNFIYGMVKGLVKSLWDMVTAIGEAVWAVIKPVVDFVSGVFTSIWEGIKAVGDFIVGIGETLWNGLQPVITFFAGIGESIVNGFKSVVDFFGGLGESIKTAFTSAYDALKLKFDELWTAAKQVFTEMGQAIADKFVEIGTAITNVFKDIGDGIKKAWDDAIGWIKDIFGGGGKESQDKGEGFVSKAADKIKGLIGYADGGTIPADMVANVHKGELVVPRNDLNDLRKFMANFQGNQTPQNITLKVGEKELANVMLSLNRNGYRTA